MDKMIVFTPDNSYSMLYLCDTIGIKSRILYYNMIERPVPKSYKTINNMTEIRKVVHNYGLLFKNDLLIKHVDKSIFILYSEAPITEIKERI